jgi:hypothetical protein
MKWVPDRTGRFAERPHYDPSEMDYECERIVQEFLSRKYGKVIFPISTSDLTILVEGAVDDLDLGADLSEEEGEVEGVTEFRRERRPVVKIASRLVDDPRMENRLRTTLTHEFTHVTFHSFMFETEIKPLSLFENSASPENAEPYSNKCKREVITGASQNDWMEWQAGYGCGAFLIPISALISTVRDFRENRGLTLKPISADSSEGEELIEIVASTFQTSRDAARVRMMQKNMLENASAGRTTPLFWG